MKVGKLEITIADNESKGKVAQRVCPKCDKVFAEQPAISREDNKTEICPDCGIKEALRAAFLHYKES